MRYMPCFDPSKSDESTAPKVEKKHMNIPEIAENETNQDKQ